MTDWDARSEPLDILRGGPVGVSAEEEIAAERQVLVPWLEREVALLPGRIQDEQRRRRRRALAAGAGVTTALAAAALFAFVGPWATADDAVEIARRSAPTNEAGSTERTVVAHGSATLISGRLHSGTAELLPGSRLGGASVVESPASESATLEGASGYVAVLEPGGRLGLGAQEREGDASPRSGFGEELDLERGRVSLSVPRLTPGVTFSVVTSDARVVVRGTRFSVTVLSGGTCVEVEEGKVEVVRPNRTEVLGAGESSGCSPEATTPSTDARSRAAAGRLDTPTESTLAAESALLAAGLLAEQSGDRARARLELRRLLERYPSSPLAAEARAAMLRLERPTR